MWRIKATRTKLYQRRGVWREWNTRQAERVRKFDGEWRVSIVIHCNASQWIENLILGPSRLIVRSHLLSFAQLYRLLRASLYGLYVRLVFQNRKPPRPTPCTRLEPFAEFLFHPSPFDSVHLVNFPPCITVHGKQAAAAALFVSLSLSVSCIDVEFIFKKVVHTRGNVNETVP